MIMRKILAAVSILASFSFACSVAQAQGNIFLSFPDSDIIGESGNQNHLDEVDVLVFSWNLTSEAGKKSTTNVATNGLKLIKLVDSSTAALLTKTVMGENLGRAVIAVEGPGERCGHTDVLVLTLNDATIASVSSIIEEGTDRPSEEIVFNFTSLGGVYTKCAVDGSTSQSTWSFVSNVIG